MRSQSAFAFSPHVPALILNEWKWFSDTLLVWAHILVEYQFEARAAHPAYQQHWRHCREPAGLLGRCDPLFYLSLPSSWLFLLVFTFFYAFLLLCLNLRINCFVHPWFSFTSYQFLHVTILSPLLCLTFPSVLPIFYLALTKATIINTCLCDTCPILFPLISVGLIATVKFFPWCSCKFQINSSHITQLSHHLVFLHVGIWGKKKCVLGVSQGCRSLYLSRVAHAPLTPRRTGLSHSCLFAHCILP